MSDVGVLELRRPELTDDVKVGEAVTSATWSEMASLANWTRGKGAMLVPTCMPLRTVGDTTTDTFRFRVKTRSSAIRRVWRVSISCASGSGASAIVIKAPASTGTALDAFVTPSTTRFDVATFVYVEDLASQAASETEITISVEADGDDIVVESISCYEEDRASLALDATDYGVFVPSLYARQPIADYSYRSVGGIVDALANLDARRVGIIHWTQGDSEASEVTTSTAKDIFVPMPVLARKDLRSSTTGSVKWSAYAKVSAGATGTIAVATTESGVSDSTTVTSTSFAWITSRAISIDAEDLNVNDGRRDSVWDLLSCKISVTGGGTPKFTVKSFSVWED